MERDYLVVAGRITPEALTHALDVGYVVHSFVTQGLESTAFVIKTENATLSLREQMQRIWKAGYVCVHPNPRPTDIRTVVTGALTQEPCFEWVSPPQ